MLDQGDRFHCARFHCAVKYLIFDSVPHLEKSRNESVAIKTFKLKRLGGGQGMLTAWQLGQEVDCYEMGFEG